MPVEPRADRRTARRRAALLTILTVTASIAITAVRGTATVAAEAATPRQDQEVGAALYGRDCAGCHGAEGQGTPRGLPLIDAGEATAHYALVTGRMPLRDPEQQPRRGPSPYTDAEIEALTAHVAGFGDGPALPDVDWRDADAARGGVLYRLHCGACHGATGSGSALAYERTAPSLREAEPSVIAAAVVSGPGAMPAFGRQGFTDEELAELVAFVQEIQSPVDRGGWPIFRTGRPDEALVTWFLAVPAVLVAAGWLARRVR